MSGIPYRSKMQPHWELIRSMRGEGATWPEIAEKLERLGVTTQAHGVQQYYKRKTQPKRGGLGLPGWGNPAPVYVAGQTAATDPPQAGNGGGEGVADSAPAPEQEAEDFDFTPSKKNDPFDKLEKALRGKRAAGKESSEKS